MFLHETEKQALEKLGFAFKDGKICLPESHEEAPRLIYCGFNTYATLDGDLFEKQADTSLRRVESEEVLAQKRFICKHRSKG